VIAIGSDWQEAENLVDAPPSLVVARALETFYGRVCFPPAVLERL
jgi:hypothetical protein